MKRKRVSELVFANDIRRKMQGMNDEVSGVGGTLDAVTKAHSIVQSLP